MYKIIKIMIVDDHILIRQGIKQLLESDGDIKIIDEAGDGNECLEKLKFTMPDIVLLDINMPIKNGIEVLKEIKNSKINVKTLILTAQSEYQYLVSAINNGADGYLLKNIETSELRKAIHIIASGKKYVQSSLTQILNYELENKLIEKKKINFLTKREKEVLVKVSHGMSNKEIATYLNISERTVKNHVSNIFKKIKVSDRTQAAIYAIKNDFITV